jgi:RNA polymerase sigma-70 factor, ECF subfamily
VSKRANNAERTIEQATKQLLARASDSRGLDPSSVVKRVSVVVEKYLLRDDEAASAEAISSFIASLQVEDLCLVMACEKGDQRAWDELVERFSVVVRSAARNATSNEDAAEDLAQSIWAELHGLRVRDDGRPAGKLSYYSGRGSLAGWLRAVVAQLAIDQHRKQARLVQTEEEGDLDRLASDLPGESTSVPLDLESPADRVEQKFAAKEINKALAKAVSELSGEDRLLVKLYYFDELKLREAGAVLGVHEATASRRLTRIHQQLRSEVQRVLIEEHRWTSSEAERCFAEVALHLDTNLERLVTAGRAQDETARSGS